MNILNEIIALMNKEQIRSFKLYANRMDIKGERKDLALLIILGKVAMIITTIKLQKNYIAPTKTLFTG